LPVQPAIATASPAEPTTPAFSRASATAGAGGIALTVWALSTLARGAATNYRTHQPERSVGLRLAALAKGELTCEVAAGAETGTCQLCRRQRRSRGAAVRPGALLLNALRSSVPTE
jgi:hypothetical protein